MTTLKSLIVTICLASLSPLAVAQGGGAQGAQTAPAAAPPHVSPAEAKNHVGEMATVCGKVVSTKVFPKYGNAGRGKPVSFDLDQPEPNRIFYFVTYGATPDNPEEAAAAYKDKHVCVTGKINVLGGTPLIMAADRSQIKPQPENK